MPPSSPEATLTTIRNYTTSRDLTQYGTTYMLLLGVIAVVMATKAPRGIWGSIAKRWDVHLFPVRRRLALEEPPKPESPAAAGTSGPVAEAS